MARLRQNLHSRAKLSSTLKSWLPILQSSTLDLEDVVNKMSEDNPYLETDSPIRQSLDSSLARSRRSYAGGTQRSSAWDKIESLSIYEKSLVEVLQEQIMPPLFPTKTSQDIAMGIIDNISDEGYFEGDLEEFCANLNEIGVSTTPEEVERVRMRFSHLDPVGVGARDVHECFVFQLDQSPLDGEEYCLALKILEHLDLHADYKDCPGYSKVMSVIKTFKSPPALEYGPKEPAVIADIKIVQEGNSIELVLDDSYYPSIKIIAPENAKLEKNAFFRAKVKEANDLIDALEMRKSTLRKIGLMIVEYQYEFFTGGDIKPMRLKDLADEFNHSPSTISRAIQNKYLECNRGIFPIKSFFTTAVDGDTSNASIKDFLLELIKDEDRKKPLSDMKILSLIERKFSLRMVRRTITKYRKQLNIPSSSERKKMYAISIS